MGTEYLSDEVGASLIRALGAYIRNAPRQELPGRLRRFHGFRPQTLQRHRTELLEALERDDAWRARVLEWLDEGSTKLSPEDEKLLRLACERPEGWQDELRALERADSGEATPSAGEELERALEAQAEKTRRARRDARAARDESRRAVESERVRRAGLEDDLGAARRDLREARADLDEERRRAVESRAELERRLRRAGRDVDRARAEQAALRADLKTERRKVADLARRLEALERRRMSPEAGDDRGRGDPVRPSGRTRARRPLRAPLGRLEDDPETLDEWMSEHDVHLLVDGYNVTKARGGYGRLELAGQRQRLVQDLERLARRKHVRATIVFDGSLLPPGTARRHRGKQVEVHYSKPPASGDDHLVALLSDLPPEPVIVATDDRELQERVRRLGATVALSAQLLNLMRRP
jgi:predicted RNA-binding protein with PIN domain